eukprot:EG_transcript_43325
MRGKAGQPPLEMVAENRVSITQGCMVEQKWSRIYGSIASPPLAPSASTPIGFVSFLNAPLLTKEEDHGTPTLNCFLGDMSKKQTSPHPRNTSSSKALSTGRPNKL